MRLKVFGVTIRNWNETETKCFKEPIQELDLEVEKWTEILIDKNEITVVFTAYKYYPRNNRNPVETMTYYFNIKEEYFDNGGGFATLDAPEVDWDKCRKFYKKYASAQDDFIDALEKGDLENAKRLHKQNPKMLKPSISNSFYARWIVKTGNLEFLKWAKSVDDKIDFGPNPRFLNPLIIAIEQGYEEIGIWLIDNYPEMPVVSNYDPLELLKKAHKKKLDKLVGRMIQNPDLLDLVFEKQALELLPETVKSVFIF